MQREQRRHRGEGRADEDGSRVLEARADDRQRDCRRRGGERGHADGEEMDVRVDLNRVLAEQRRRTAAGANATQASQREHGQQTLPERDPHVSVFGRKRRELNTQLAYSTQNESGPARTRRPAREDDRDLGVR